jgi:hypothetical protein
VVCSFNYDEPVAAILAAARLTPDVRFFITGNPRHLTGTLAAQLPPNVTLTGFLSTPAYGGLLAGADVVLTLTTRDHTMLRGAYEAIYQGTPVIVSDWPVLVEAFELGAIHVDNTPADCCRVPDGSIAARILSPGGRSVARSKAAQMDRHTTSNHGAPRRCAADSTRSSTILSRRSPVSSPGSVRISISSGKAARSVRYPSPTSDRYSLE